MKNNFCDKEQAVVAALINGALPDTLRSHADTCEVCSEVVLVAQSLLQDVVPDSAELRAPDASVIWRSAQSLARKKAIEKATRPIRIARACSYVAAMVAAPWLVRTFLSSDSSMTDFMHHLSTLDHPLLDSLTSTMLGGILVCLIVISVSSWYVLRQE